MKVTAGRINWFKVIPGAMAIVVVMSAHPARCQEVRGIVFTEFRSALVLGWEGVDETERNSQGLPLIDFSERYFESGMEFQFGGYSYHPNLLEFHAEGLVLYEKSSVDEQTSTRELSETNPNYNVHLRFFKKKLVRVSAYLSSSIESADRAFLGRYYNLNRRKGLRVDSSYGGVPVELEISQTDTRYSSILLDRFDERNIETNNIHLMTRLNVGEQNSGDIRFTFLDYEETNYDTRYENTRLTGRWTTVLNRERHEQWDNLFNFSDFSGSTDQRMLTIRTSYRRDLSETLTFNAAGGFSGNRFGNFDSTSVSLDANIDHELYRSLRSRAGLFVRRYDYGVQQRDIVGEKFGINYRKKIPTGDVKLSLSHSFSQQQNDGTGETTSRSEYAAFDVSDTILISTTGVDAASIVVTSPDLSALYILDVDYMLLVLPGAILITRIPGGNIPAFGSIQINYEFASAPTYELNTHEYRNDLQLRFMKYFTVGYRVRASRNTVDSMFTMVPYESYKAKRLEWGVQWKNLTFRQSTEEYDGNLSTYTTDSYLGSCHLMMGPRLRVQYSISETETDYEDIDHFTRLKNQNFTIAWSSYRGFTTSISYWDLTYEDASAGIRDRVSLVCKLTWPIRKLLLTATYQYLLQDNKGTERERSYYNISLRRQF